MKITIRNLKNRKVVMEAEFKNRGTTVTTREGSVEIKEFDDALPVIWKPFYHDQHYITINK